MAESIASIVKRTHDKLQDHLKRVNELTSADVLVGIPADKSGRKEGSISNAALAYIHEFGSPAHNIPARPFLIPGIMKVRKRLLTHLKQGAHDCLFGDAKPQAILHQVGILARNSVVEQITDPAPPFAPLKPATIRARLRRTQAGRRKLKQLKTIKEAAEWSGGKADAALSMWGQTGGNIHPLIDTGQIRAAISYVVRLKGQRIDKPNTLPAGSERMIRLAFVHAAQRYSGGG